MASVSQPDHLIGIARRHRLGGGVYESVGLVVTALPLDRADEHIVYTPTQTHAYYTP